MQALVVLLVWLLYFGLTALVIVVDGNLQRAKVEREGGVDFMNRNPLPYLVAGLLCGPLPLIFYFGSTRRSAVGYAMGVGAAIAVYVFTLIGGKVLVLVLGA